MNTKRILVFSFFISLALVSPLWAATYYVDNTLGSASDTNAGTSTTAPWRNCPGLSGWSGSATLRAGDIVYFKNSGVWKGAGGNSLLEATGGVTYDGSSWGTGTRATLQATGSFTRAIVSIRADNPTIETVVKGFNVDGNGTSNSGMTVNWPSSVTLTGAVKRIDNCDIHDLRPVKTGSARYGIKVGSIAGAICRNVEILNTKVHDISTTGIAIYPAVNCPTCLVENVAIKGCVVGPNITQYDTWNGTGIIFKNNQDNILLENSEIYGAELNNVIIQDDGSGAPQTLTIRHNLIHDGPRHGIAVQTPSTTVLDIYGNLIYRNGKNGIEFATNVSGGSNRVKLYNNTFYQNAWGEINFSSSSATYSTLEIKNNIFSSRSDQTPFKSAKNIFTARSNNLYYRPGGGTLATLAGTNYSSSNLGSFEGTAVSSDPAFADPSKGNFTLSTGSGASGKGADLKLSLLNPGSKWTDNVILATQSVSSGFNIGAYASYGGVSKTLSGLTITGPSSVNESSSGTYTATATWSDGSSSTVTPLWSENSSYATISTGGVLTTTAVTANQTVTVGASYTSGGVTKTAAKSVDIVDVSTTKTLSGLVITGPGSVNESSSGTYTATATWSDGSSSMVTPLWSENSSYATISADGVLTTTAVTADQAITVSASYTSGGVTMKAAKSVGIVNFSTEVPSGAIKPSLGTVTTPMQLVSSPDAPGGSYIETTTSNSGGAVYNFNIDQPGTYKIVATVYAAGAGSDSFLVKIDNGPQDIWDMNPAEDPALYNIWRQDEVTARGTGAFSAPQFDPLTVELAAGPHTITFSGRESAARLAYSYFMLVSPADAKPAAKTSVLLFRAESGALTADTMKVVSALDVPSGSYITPTSSTSARAVYDFNIDQPGTYKIIAEVYSADNASDSFLVKIDNNPEDIWDLNPKSDPAFYKVWRQDEVTARGTGAFDAPQFDPLKVQLAAGPHTITISGRELNSRLAYFYLTKVAGDTALIEAESGKLTAPMQTVADAAASGGAYIATTTNDSGSAVYSFNITQPGIYKVIARVYAAGSGSDSFRVKIDNGAEDIWDLNPTENPALYNLWRQDEVATRGTGTFAAPQNDPLAVQLAAGNHTITFSGREKDARLDNFYLVQITTEPSIIKLKID